MAIHRNFICMLLAGALAANVYCGDEEAPKGKRPAKESGKERKKVGAQYEQQWDRGFDLLKENEKELNLSDDQKKKLESLRKEIGEKLSKLKDDPEMIELYTEMYQARQVEDKEHIAEVQKKIGKALDKKGLDREAMMLQFGKILTPQQLKKLAEIRKKNGMEENPMKKVREERAEDKKEAERERPDPNKGAPSLYENEK
ncbi:MAG TPA: hypothetical protein VEJ63_18280 [Planctomycetota bacterium]|nr:hypothetical protein [Planctomycetota bacterium]